MRPSESKAIADLLLAHGYQDLDAFMMEWQREAALCEALRKTQRRGLFSRIKAIFRRG